MPMIAVGTQKALQDARTERKTAGSRKPPRIFNLFWGGIGGRRSEGRGVWEGGEEKQRLWGEVALKEGGMEGRRERDGKPVRIGRTSWVEGGWDRVREKDGEESK